MAKKHIIPDFSDVQFSDAVLFVGFDAELSKTAIEHIWSENYKEALKLLSQLIKKHKNTQLSGIILLYVGFIYAVSGKLSEAIDYWKRGFVLAPKAQIYNILKIANINHPDDLPIRVCLQMVINKIADDGYEQVVVDKKVIHPSYGEVEYWDSYLDWRIVRKCMSNPANFMRISDEADAKPAFIFAHANNVSADDISALQKRGQWLKRNNHLLDSAVAYQSVAAIMPDANDAQYNLGKVFYLMEEYALSVGSYMRCLHLEIQRAILFTDIRRELESTLAYKLGADMIPQLEKISPLVRFFYNDVNTAIHLGFAVCQFAKLPHLNQFAGFLKNYPKQLAGQEASPMTADISLSFFKLGLVFALENIDFSELSNVAVRYLYNDPSKYYFQHLIGLKV